MSFERSQSTSSNKAETFESSERDNAPGFQEAALAYLREEDKEYFDREFSGELDTEGYLLRKDGTSSNTKPSQNISGKGMQQVTERLRTKEKTSTKDAPCRRVGLRGARDGCSTVTRGYSTPQPA